MQQDVFTGSITIDGTCIINPTLPSPQKYNPSHSLSIQIAIHLFELGDYYKTSLKFTEWLENSPDF